MSPGAVPNPPRNAGTPRIASRARRRAGRSATGASLAGIPLHPQDVRTTMAWIASRAAARRPEPIAIVSTVNVDFLTLARNDPSFAELLRTRTVLNLIDGWPVARLLERRLRRPVLRSPGSDLTHAILTDPAMRPHGVYLLGDQPETLAALCARGDAEGWKATVRGAYSPGRAEVESEEGSAALVDRINASGARVLLVAFGAPRQERWLVRWADHLAPAVGIGVGGSFKFVAWPARRAPVWMQRAGLEWLHRVLLEPGRLAPRYARNFVDLVRLARET